MKVVIPLAGFGTRLRPHTYTKPKPLLNVAGKPVLGHILDQLKDIELDEVIFIVGYLGDQIREYVETNYHFPSRFFEQKELLGQAHAIWLAREAIEGPILIIFVDTIFEANLLEIPQVHADGILYVKEVADPRRFGVAVTDSDGLVTQLIEKPAGFDQRMAVVGVYHLRDGAWLNRAIEQLMAENRQTKGEFYLADAFQVMIEQGARFVTRPVDVWEDCGKPETVLHTNRYLLEHGGAHVGRAQIEDSTIIQPVYIADNACIKGSIVGPFATIATGACVQNSLIRDSIVDEDAIIEDTMLCESLIGKGALVRGRYRKLNVGDSSQVDFGAL